MIPKSEGLDVIRLLLEKTKQGQLSWSYNEQGEYTIEFARFSFLIAKKEQNGAVTYFFSIVSQKNQLGLMEARGGDAAFESLEDLFDEAARNTVVSLLEEAKRLLETPERVFHIPQATTATSPPPLPQPPNGDQVAKILTKVTGQWNLDYSRGQEPVIIDSAGNYYINPADASQRKPPSFRLAIIACNPELTVVEWRKDKINGTSLQIEVLNLTESKIEGFAKHDEHRLVYTRTKGTLGGFSPHVEINPQYDSDLRKLDGRWDLSAVLDKSTVVVVVGDSMVAELLDRIAAGILRDVITQRGGQDPFRRAVIVGYHEWATETKFHRNPTISIGSEAINKLSGEIVRARRAAGREPWPEGNQGFGALVQSTGSTGARVALWGKSAADTRAVVEHYIQAPKGLHEFLEEYAEWK